MMGATTTTRAGTSWPLMAVLLLTNAPYLQQHAIDERTTYSTVEVSKKPDSCRKFGHKS